MRFFKKKKFSGNSVIMKYKVKTHLGFFSRRVIKQNLILYTRIQMDQTFNKI
jgi:hypothetical protein